MLRVALTGGIACGKSIVAQILRDKGCYLFSADAVAHEMMSPNRPAWKKIVRRFGEKILNPDATIDKIRLSGILFSEPQARRFLNDLVHPLVQKERKRVIARLEREGRFKIFVSEAALTIEAGYSDQFNRVLVVHCSEPERLQRLMKRDKIDEREAKRKITAQMSQDEKLRHADYAIDTSGSYAETVEQTEIVFAHLMLDYELEFAKGRRRSPARRD